MLHAAPLALEQRVASEAGARHTVGVADRDRAAVDVQLVHRDAERVGAIEHLDSECLVEFPQADVADLEAEALEQFGDGIDRADAHFVGLGACDGHTEIASERGKAALRRHLAGHNDTGRGAVAEL